LSANSSGHQLTGLVAHPDRLSPLRLWAALTSEERIAAAQAALSSTEADRREGFVKVVATSRGFRQQTVHKWDDKKLALELGRTRLRAPDLAADLLAKFHFAQRSALLCAFMDALSIPHENGSVSGDDLNESRWTSIEISAAADALAQQFGHRAVVVYLLTLITLSKPGFQDNLWDWLQSNPLEHDPGHSDATLDSELGEDENTEEKRPDEHAGFTTMDTLLVHSAIATAQGIEGALSVDAIQDLLDELIQLNHTRHRSYFHLGLCDVLFHGEARRDLPAQNEARSRWYWAGAIQAFARQEEWATIVAEYDQTPLIRALGDGQDHASESVVLWIAEALRKSNRTIELSDFVSTDALRHSPRLYRSMLDSATEMLRADDGAGARSLLEALIRATDAMVSDGFSSSNPLFLEAHRRMAHCHRQLGEMVQARQGLTQLLELDQDANIQAMVRADLGLIAGGFRRLAEVRLDGPEPALVVEALDKGLEHFTAAHHNRVSYSSHGQFCLGVTALFKQNWDEALRFLEEARASFRANRNRYKDGPIVARCDLYFGIAAAHSLRAEKLGIAAKAIQDGLQAGAQWPWDLVESTMTCLSIGGPELIEPVLCTSLLADPTESTLDALLGIPNLKSTTVATRLYVRAMGEGRSSELRARDLRAALAAHLDNFDHDTASEILDHLEELAVSGAGQDEFAALLEDPGAYEPAWSREDALIAEVRCREAAGALAPAATLLLGHGHRLLARGRDGALEEAIGILEHVKTYGLDEDVWTPFASHLTGLCGQEGQPRQPPEATPVSVLVVGGDEGNSKHDEAIRRALAERAPHISVAFIRPGWSGNWRKALDDTKRAMKKADAMVLMRLMRTEFGKQVRASTELPYRHCYGAGTTLVVSTIIAAATWGQPRGLL
jgi:tetratricopeptide (TPR) repeat protein